MFVGPVAVVQAYSCFGAQALDEVGVVHIGAVGVDAAVVGDGEGGGADGAFAAAEDEDAAAGVGVVAGEADGVQAAGGPVGGFGVGRQLG
ncbi:hypothetical protein GCM10010195_72730 [Kitasatospora griseola]|nr:hypothetical protein GCM10010195_72730 [Kitasatospora griseola]